MRAYLPAFDAVSPTALKDALQRMAEKTPPVPLAGGTDLMVLMNAGDLKPCQFLNLQSIRELQGEPVVITPEGARLSALATYTDARRHAELRRYWPLMALTAREIGAIQIQNRGTWAGNIVNGSPAADGVPVLMAYDAEVELTSLRGMRRAALADFYTGYKKMDRWPDELLTAIYLPRPPKGRIEYYRKVGTRKFQAISKTLLTGWITQEKGTVTDLRLVYASVAPYTLRARKTEGALRGKPLTARAIASAQRVLTREIKPIDDIRSTAEYRQTVSLNLLEEFLEKALP